ncbi:MAG TPA: hypothetical protein PLC42_01420 [Parachlamydiaceae bacterium]|nr:hypothetical protein [Parachlamydiaceae bacterium]
MSSLPPVQEGQFINIAWQKAAPAAVPIMAASVAIIPFFYGFALKSARQLNDPVHHPIPKFDREMIKSGFKASPTIGMIVGTQLIAQDRVEKIAMKCMGTKDPKDVKVMFISAAIVGLISAPALAVFNGQTIKGRTPMECLRSLSVKQASAIVTRETSFLLAIRISGPLSEMMKNRTENNKIAQYASMFFTGAIGSLVGHPADTALTLWQKNKKISGVSSLMRGSIAKAIALGGFSVVYNVISETLKPKN